MCVCLWGSGERWAFWVLCLEAGGFQNEVSLWSERRSQSEKVAFFLADAILGGLLASDVELETAFKGCVPHTATHLAGWEFQIKRISWAHAELWLVSQPFSALGRTEDLLAGRGTVAFPLAALSFVRLCCRSWSQHPSFYCSNHGFAI